MSNPNSITVVRAALFKAFLDAEIFDPSKIAFENVAFTPPNKTPWCSLFFVPTQPTVGTLGPEGTDRLNGFVQIDLNYPLNSGTAEIEEKADYIEKLFTAGFRPAYSEQEVVVRSCGRSQGRIVNGFYKISMTVYFYADVKRSTN